MTITEALKYKDINITDAQILLSFVLGKDKLFLLTNGDYSLTEKEEKEYIRYVKKRLTGVPVSYITHQREFYGRNFYVDENVLIPRPETELMIDVVKSLPLPPQPRILDLCTGSGIIPITLSLELGLKIIFGTDISPLALKVARKNNRLLGATLRTIESDMFRLLPQAEFDVITANPPYIPTGDLEGLDEDVKREPTIALDGGRTGLDFYEILLSQGKDYLTKEGFMVLEIGYNQKKDIKALAKEYKFKAKFFKDLQGYNRVVLLCDAKCKINR